MGALLFYIVVHWLIPAGRKKSCQCPQRAHFISTDRIVKSEGEASGVSMPSTGALHFYRQSKVLGRMAQEECQCPQRAHFISTGGFQYDVSSNFNVLMPSAGALHFYMALGVGFFSAILCQCPQRAHFFSTLPLREPLF